VAAAAVQAQAQAQAEAVAATAPDQAEAAAPPNQLDEMAMDDLVPELPRHFKTGGKTSLSRWLVHVSVGCIAYDLPLICA